MNLNDSMLSLPEGVSLEYLRHHRVCPIGMSDAGEVRLLVAPDALLDDALPELALAYSARITPEHVNWQRVHEALENLGGPMSTVAEELYDDLSADLRDLASQVPVIRYVNQLIQQAVDLGASDIHIDAARTGAVSRLRVDGVLSPTVAPPPEYRFAVVSRIKLLAGLDIAEHRLPQDGRIRVRLALRDLDLRVSAVPTMHGESLVLRLLESHGRPAHLEDLGMPIALRSAFRAMAQRSHGLVLVTGPTGSGKTTTLYAALQCRNLREEKVLTVEDPVEFHLPDISQVPVQREIGLSFSAALRSLLRQDPDVLMIGETRDRETAEIAVQAAMTGHLVLSTLHTTDAVSAVPRLLDLGIAPYLLAATLDGVLAQRLVRRNCDHCREEYEPAASVRDVLDRRMTGVRLVRGRGCPRCRHTGFKGRLGIFELLSVNAELRDAIARGARRAEFESLVETYRPISMSDDGIAKVVAGDTTIEEVHRAIHE